MLSEAIRRYFNRSALRSVRERGSRVDRFKLAEKSRVRELLLANPQVGRAVAAHGAADGLSADKVWSRVEEYIDEIIPSFNILAYYRFGYVVSRSLLHLFYKVSAEHHPAWSGRPLPRDAIYSCATTPAMPRVVPPLVVVLGGSVSRCPAHVSLIEASRHASA